MPSLSRARLLLGGFLAVLALSASAAPTYGPQLQGLS